MSSIKIYPPNQLPAEGVTDVSFGIWKEEMEIYLEIEKKFRNFLPGGLYESWTPAEQNEKRILTAIEPDTEDKLPDLRRDLRQFIAIIAKHVHCDYYNPIMRHSSSLKWIYNKLREDYNIQTQGIHFFNILDLAWDPVGNMTPIGFYNQYRSLIISNLGKKDTLIQWKNDTLKEDERLTCSHEDLIFLNVLQLLHPKLPAYIREQYAHKIGKEKRLMDFKTEILSKAKIYICEITGTSTEDESLQCNYMSTPRSNPKPNWRGQSNHRKFQPNNSYQRSNSSNHRQPSQNYQRQNQRSSTNQSSPFCRVCHLSGLDRSVYTSHYLGQPSCPSLSDKDKQLLTNRIGQQLGAINLDEDEPEDEIAQEYGYSLGDVVHDTQNEQVKEINNFKENVITVEDTKDYDFKNNYNFSSNLTCNYIQPIPTQTLTVQDSNNKNVHLDLDSGATVSYAKLSTVQAHGFKIRPNSQLSNLADGKTKLMSLGEINETFSRNSWSVNFHAIVCKDLHCDFVAGNNFMKTNSIIQDLNAKTISVHKKFVISETSKSLILPTEPNNLLLQNSHLNVILPGQNIDLQVPHKDDTILAIQPWYQNQQQQWPQPQICSVKNGRISVKNNSIEPVHVKKATKVQARTMIDPMIEQSKPYMKTALVNDTNKDNTAQIEINKDDIKPDIIEYINDINNTYKDVFNENLTTGYNHRFGKHIAKLNWAGPNRPSAAKVQNINYDHETKKLLQDVCDDLTNKGVLGIPQEHDIKIQYCSPSFLVRKQKAKNKSKQDLAMNDVRLVVNFSKMNNYLKNMPTTITKPKDIFSQLGKWNYIITMDLQSGFFQNHMSMQDAEWLGITTPFGGMRFMKRSGQGLIGQSEELDELLCKILGPEMKDGKVSRIADDIYIGGRNEKETADNYKDVLQKFQAANIKISASKTKVFLKSVDILGWKWNQGGFLSPSPHRVNALRNTKYTDIKNVKDLRSYLGLYKTLLPASPNLTLLLNPFDMQVADRDSKETIEWNRDLIAHFQDSTKAVDDLQTIYLPHPEDQLLIEVDAAKTPPGIGHTVYAIKDGKKIPVAFHSVKLSPTHQKWMACELEALAFATAITAEYETLKECKKPVILSPDSKPVADAVKLIQKGQYSASPRIQSFISNVNRLPIIVQLASGKSNQNQSSDFQSRHPSKCDAEHCTICNFVTETSDSVLIPAAINNIHPESTMNNKKAWNNIQNQQKACKEAKYLLKSGKTPNKMSGKINSEIRRLCSVAKLDKDNLLIVPSQQNKFSSKQTDLIVIPQTHLPALLWQIHNNLKHPSKSQLKANFDKIYYSVGLMANIEQLYDDCFFCSSQKKIPDTSMHHTITESIVPGTHFHADVIKRQSQMIFTIRDHFSSFTSAKIIKSESNQELKKAIIDTVLPLKLSGDCHIKVDNATGFIPLLHNKDPELSKLNIKVTATDVFNKNANAVIDKACFEIEQELKRIEPDGRPISNTTLQLAVSSLNNKLRRKGQISAFEIHFNRDMYTGQNLNLDYKKIREDQLKTRDEHNLRYNNSIKQHQKTDPKPGDIVVTTNKADKHKAKDIFLVADSTQHNVTVQKIIHPHSSKPSLRSKQYITDKNRLFVTRNLSSYNSSVIKPRITKPPKETWNPIRVIDDDSEDDDNIKIIPPDNNNEDTNENDIPSEDDEQYNIPAETVDDISTYHIHIRPQTPSKQQSVLYNQLEKDLIHQRKVAADQLQQITDQEILEPPTEVSKTAPKSTLTLPRSSVRAQSIEARKKISTIYQKTPKNILQIDGCMTSSDTSSTETTNVTHRHRISTTRADLLDSTLLTQASDDDSISDMWDYSDNVELDNPDIIFPTPTLDDSFMNPPLNLSATSMTVAPNRVYTLNSLLERTPIVPTGLSNIGDSSQKKEDANH